MDPPFSIFFLTGEHKGQITIPLTILWCHIFFSPQSNIVSALFCGIPALLEFFLHCTMYMLMPLSWYCYLQVDCRWGLSRDARKITYQKDIRGCQVFDQMRSCLGQKMCWVFNVREGLKTVRQENFVRNMPGHFYTSCVLKTFMDLFAIC